MTVTAEIIRGAVFGAAIGDAVGVPYEFRSPGEMRRHPATDMEGNGTYEVIAAFPGQVLNVGEEGFRYYDFYDAASAEEFDTYISEIKSRCTYQIPTTAEFGDHLITLSTCENSGASEGKRFVVVAKRID